MIAAVACSVDINRTRKLTLNASIREIAQTRIHFNARLNFAAAPAHLGTNFAFEAGRTVPALDTLIQTWQA